MMKLVAKDILVRYSKSHTITISGFSLKIPGRPLDACRTQLKLRFLNV